MLGDFIRTKRLSFGLSLRQFCDMLKIDSSNWSKVERGLIPLTLTEEKLDEMKGLLNIEKRSNEEEEFDNLVMIAKKKIPDHVYSDEEILKALPVLFRAAGGERPTERQKKLLYDLIKDR